MVHACAPYTRTSDLALVVRVFFFSLFFFFSFFLFFFFPKSSTRPSRQPIVPRSSTPFYISANWWSNYFLKFNSFVSDSLRVDSWRAAIRYTSLSHQSGVVGPRIFARPHRFRSLDFPRSFAASVRRKENFHGHPEFPKEDVVVSENSFGKSFVADLPISPPSPSWFSFNDTPLCRC